MNTIDVNCCLLQVPSTAQLTEVKTEHRSNETVL